MGFPRPISSRSAGAELTTSAPGTGAGQEAVADSPALARPDIGTADRGSVADQEEAADANVAGDARPALAATQPIRPMSSIAEQLAEASAAAPASGSAASASGGRGGNASGVERQRRDGAFGFLQKRGYEYVKKIGEGAYGKALLTKDASGVSLVCKMVDVSKASSKEAQDSLRECHVLAKLKHPHIVQHRTSFQEGGWICLVMEYCDGGDLSGLIRRARQRQKPFSESEVLRLFTQAASALEYLHMNGILHRDLKPHNLFLTKGGHLKLGDFGIAKVLDCTMACAHTQVGTPAYLCPEVIQDRPYGRPADIWALGCILYEMCALERPFDCPSLIQLAQKVLKAKSPALPSAYSDFLRQLCDEMLSKAPEKRPSSAQILEHPQVADTRSAQLEEAGSSATLLPLLRLQPGEDAAASSRRAFTTALTKTIGSALASRTEGNTICASAPMCVEEEESMRRFYLDHVESDPDAIFSELALPLKEALMQTEGGQELLAGPARSVTISAGDAAAVDIDKEMFSVGRKPFCEVRFRQDNTSVSRVHLWIFNFPGGIVVVDGWSCSGAAMTCREREAQELQKSRPGKRRSFIVFHGEAATLDIGREKLAFSPKLCAVCLVRPRAVHLNCGHKVLCKECVGQSQLVECPVCRAPIDRFSARDTHRACVGHTYDPTAN